MTVATTTVRMPVASKAIFQAAAKRRGLSLAAFLVAEAERVDAEEWFRQEREATAGSLDAESASEQALWQDTDDDWD
ncbi:MAG: hypothetical protein LBR32_08715 [Propionibacteriaceae bacterium]|nr:hypothetical protein [Propionibacteriaceae bacterium]